MHTTVLYKSSLSSEMKYSSNLYLDYWCLSKMVDTITIITKDMCIRPSVSAHAMQ